MKILTLDTYQAEEKWTEHISNLTFELTTSNASLIFLGIPIYHILEYFKLLFLSIGEELRNVKSNLWEKNILWSFLYFMNIMYLNYKLKPTVEVHTFNFCTREAMAGRSRWGQGQSGYKTSFRTVGTTGRMSVSMKITLLRIILLISEYIRVTHFKNTVKF